MDLSAHYQSLFQSSLDKLRQNDYFIDDQITNAQDRRRGITLLIRPDANTKSRVLQMVGELRQRAPSQYFYPASDLHITVMSIISCYNGFQLEAIDPKKYVEVIEKSLRGITPFGVHYAGITLSPTGPLLAGFPENNHLKLLRDQLRRNFGASPLQQSLDKRYAIQTAHSSIMRYQCPLQDHDKLIQYLLANQYTDLGRFVVSELELVYNDWYQRAENVTLLHRFRL